MPRAFHLEVGPDRLATLTFDLPDRRANIFTRAALAELDAGGQRPRRCAATSAA